MSERPRRFVSTTVEVEGRTEERVVEVSLAAPVPWDLDAPLTHVGARAPRIDGPAKTTGRARYTTDIRRPRQLEAVIVRATIARGVIRVIDPATAAAMPGVQQILLPGDVPDRLRLLAREITFIGQPIAVVCADSLAAAEAAARALRIEYDTLPHATTIEDALAEGAAPVRPGITSNLLGGKPTIAERGDVDAALSSAEVVVRRTIRTPCVLHTALEPHGAVAEWEGDQLVVWESTQGIFRVRDNLAKAFQLPLSQVRVICEAMGGGFGAKNYAGPHTLAAAFLARALGRPVRCINDRTGEQMASGNRPATVQQVTLGARRDGTLTAILLEADIPLGIGGWEGGPGQIYHEMHQCPNVRTVERFAFINAGAMAAFRGPGYAEGAIGLELTLDALAREIGMDPLVIREKNLAELDQRRDRPYTGNRLAECYRVGAERFGWNASRIAPSGTKRRGRGVAAQIWPTGGGPPAYASVRLNADGSAEVHVGTQDLGTGTRTILAQVAAEALGHRLDQVRTVLGDTAVGPYNGNSWGSMTVASVTPAVRVAAEEARAALLDAAAGLLNVEIESLSAAEGVVSIAGGEESLRFGEITAKLGNVMIQGHGSRGPNPQEKAVVTVGAQFAEVEVDLETGIVRVLRIVAVHDAGRIVNPTLAESQLEGGILQGLGYAMFEERVLDRTTAQPMNAGLHDYKIPTMADVPMIDAHFLLGADPEANHTGVRGIAEPALIPTAPAIASAVADALGVEVLELPLTPWRVLAALR